MSGNFNTLRTVPWTYSANSENGQVLAVNALIGHYPTSAEAKQTISAVTPNFSAYEKKRYLLPDNGYKYRHDRWVDYPTQLIQLWIPTHGDKVVYYYANTVSNALAGSDPFGYFTKVPTEDLRQKVIAKLQDKIKLGQTEALVSLVEMHKTAAMIAVTATRLSKAFLALKRVDFVGFSNSLGLTRSQKTRSSWRRATRKHGVSQPKFEWRSHPVTGKRYRYHPPLSESAKSRLNDFAADTWLEYSYGWIPLINDVYNTAKASASLGIEMSNQVREVSAAARASNFLFDSREVNQFIFKGSCIRTENLRYQLHYRIEDGGPSFSTAFGLDNPLAVAWETLPFSFVVDWFLPVGRSISALSAYNGLTFVKGTISYKQGFTCTMETTGKSWNAPGGKWNVKAYGGLFKQNILIKERTLLSTFPSYGFPQFKNPLSVQHMASALALLKTAFR